MKSVTKYVGLDVSKGKISVAVGIEGRKPSYFIGMFPHTEKAVRKLIQTLIQDGSLLEVCFEAGPTGYQLYRLLKQMGNSCSVIAPSLIPSRPGDRVKTDRRDALKLAQLLRSGELQTVYVPTEADEALRDLVRAREDSKENLLHAKHRLTKFLLRHSIQGPEGVRRWSVKYWAWLKVLRLSNTVQQTVLQEYIHAIQEEMLRLQRLEKYMVQEAQSGPHASIIAALQVLRGVALIIAVTLVAEVRSFLRFPKGSSFMSYTGLVPSEYSTGQTTRLGATTKAGNRHVRRAAVEEQLSWFANKLHEKSSTGENNKPIFVILHQPLLNTLEGSDLENTKQIVLDSFYMVGTGSIRQVEEQRYSHYARSESLVVEVYDKRVVIKKREHVTKRWIYPKDVIYIR